MYLQGHFNYFLQFCFVFETVFHLVVYTSLKLVILLAQLVKITSVFYYVLALTKYFI